MGISEHMLTLWSSLKVGLQKCVTGMCRQQRPRSAWASIQSDQGLHCPLTESLDTTECISGEQRSGLYFTHSQDDLNLQILHMFEGTYSLDAAQLLSFQHFLERFFMRGILF